jgi:hypothetical protein
MPGQALLQRGTTITRRDVVVAGCAWRLSAGVEGYYGTPYYADACASGRCFARARECQT